MVFKTAAPAAFVVVEVLGFGAVNAAALVAVATKKRKNMKMRLIEIRKKKQRKKMFKHRLSKTAEKLHEMFSDIT